MRRDVYLMLLPPGTDALVRALTVVARMPGEIARLTHADGSARLEMRGLSLEAGQLLAARLRALPCVTGFHYLPGRGPAAAAPDRLAS